MEIILETLYKKLDCILQLYSIVNIGKLDPTPHSSFYRRTCPVMLAEMLGSNKSALCLIASLAFSFVLISTSRASLQVRNPARRNQSVCRIYSRVEWTSAFKGFNCAFATITLQNTFNDDIYTM